MRIRNGKTRQPEEFRRLACREDMPIDDNKLKARRNNKWPKREISISLLRTVCRNRAPRIARPTLLSVHRVRHCLEPLSKMHLCGSAREYRPAFDHHGWQGVQRVTRGAGGAAQ